MTLFNQISKDELSESEYFTFINNIAIIAAKYGNISVVRDMVDMGANNYYSIASEAANNDHIEIVREMINLSDGEIDLISIGYNVAFKGYTKITNLIANEYPFPVRTMFYGAKKGDHKEIANTMRSLFISDD